MAFRRRAFTRGVKVGLPKYPNGTTIGELTVEQYLGHSDVNKRNSRIMAKPQHWYSCRCSCGITERRTQQELTDTRRQQKCESCRSSTQEELTCLP